MRTQFGMSARIAEEDGARRRIEKHAIAWPYRRP